MILGRDEFPDLDLVMDPSQGFALKRRLDLYAESYYIQIGDEKIRTTLKEVQIHPRCKWIYGIKFNRYIVGRPNKLLLMLHLLPSLKNVHVMRGAGIELRLRYLYVHSYYDDYLTRFEIDPSNITHIRGYKLGDL